MTQEQRLELINRQGRLCTVCGRVMENPQFAHIIANTKANRAKFGSLIIDHPLNGAMVCSLRCNDACNRGMRPIEALTIARQILDFELKKLEGKNDGRKTKRSPEALNPNRG